MSELRKIAEELSNLTVLEANELIKILSDEYGIRPLVGQKMGLAPVLVPVEEEQTQFDVRIQESGSKRLELIKLIKEVTGLGLRESKDLMDSIPVNLKEQVSKDEAEHLKGRLEEKGAVVEII